MVGLLVIAAYAIFWIICLILAVWISKISKKYRLIVGVIVFFTISFAPYYYYLYDKAMYDQACQNAEMFFPETPYEKPEILYIYEHDPQRNPPGYYTGGHIFDYMTTLPDIGNSYVVNSDGIVETIKSSVVGDFRSRFDVTPEQLERNWKVLEVYPSNEKNKLEGEKRQEVLIKLRYGIFNKLGETANTNTIREYIFDFEQGKEISAVTVINHSRSVDSDTINYLWGWRFRDCLYGEDLLERRDVGYKYLLEKTFDLKE